MSFYENLRNQVRAAKAAAPGVKPPRKAIEISGLFVKGDTEGSSWVARIVGIEHNGKAILDFKLADGTPIYTTMKWAKSEDGNPKGMKTWHLEDGSRMHTYVHACSLLEPGRTKGGSQYDGSRGAMPSLVDGRLPASKSSP